MMNLTKSITALASSVLAWGAVSATALIANYQPALALNHVAEATILDRAAIKRIVIEEAKRFGVPAPLALALAKVSSDFMSTAQSTTGAAGILQIMPETARLEHGISPDELYDPRLNIQIGLDRLARFYAQFGNWQDAIAAYHAGVDSQGRVAATSDRFIQSVNTWSERYAAQAEVWGKLELAERDWIPPHTRIRPLQPKISETQSIASLDDDFRHIYPHTKIVVQRPARALDDFAGIEARRRHAQMTLDDFGPRSDARPNRIW